MKAPWLLAISLFSSIAIHAQTNFLRLSFTELWVNEAAGQFTFSAVREGDVSTNATVDFVITSAEPEIDPNAEFATTQGTITFAPGETNQAITITVVDDQLIETNKSYILYLTNIVAEALLTNEVATLHFIDNDGRPNGIVEDFSFLRSNFTSVNDLLLLPNGKIAVAASGKSPYSIMNELGEDDTAYSAEGYFIRTNLSLALTPEEKVMAGEDMFYSPLVLMEFRYENRPFSSRHNKLSGTARKILVADSGTIFAAGTFWEKTSTNNYGLLAMNRVGLIDTNYPNSSGGLFFLTIGQNADGSLLGSYYSTNEDGTLSYGFGKWNRDGSRDTNFTSSFEALTSGAAHITVIEHEPGTNSYIAAIETQNEGSTQTHIARISESGEVDNDFYNRFPIVHGRVNTIAFNAWQPATLASGAYDNIYIGGDFSGAGDYSSKNILCLSQSGDLNWMVDNDSGPNGIVNTILPLLDGTLLVGGDFTEFGGYPGTGIVRLNASRATGQTFVYFDKATFRGYESLQEISISVTRSAANTNEETFNLTVESLRGGTAVASYPTNITFALGELQHEIRLPLINDASQGGKAFKVYLTTEDNSVSLARGSAELIVHDDETAGTIDPTYEPKLVAKANYITATPTALEVQPNGKMLIGYWDGRPKVARLNQDGSIDTEFIQNGFPIEMTDGQVYQIHPLNSGKIYISGYLIGKRTGSGANFIYRLNSDGSNDTTFNFPIQSLMPPDPGNFVTFAVLPDDTLLVGGNTFMRFKSTLSNGILYHINADGGIITTFGVSQTLSSRKCSLIVPLENGTFLAQITPSSSSNQISRFKLAGPIDNSFNLYTTGEARQILPVGNYLYLCGSLTSINNSPATTISRVDLESGVFDRSFSFSTDGVVTRILPAGNGKFYIVGDFTKTQGVDRYRIARLNSDFSLDTSFDPGYGLDYQANTLIQLPDRNVLVGGGFTRVDLTPTPTLVRFNEEPSPGYIRLITNRIVLNQSTPLAHIEVERLDGSQGTLSTSVETFDQSAISGFNYQSTNAIITYADGEFGRRSLDIPLISTNITSGHKTFGARVTSNGADEYVTISLLNEDIGELDSSFQISVPYTTTPLINTVAGLPDGRIYIGGSFTNIQGLPITNLARLNADLTVDTNFNPVVNRPVASISLQPNNDILIGGQFTSVNNRIAQRSARLRPDGALDPAFNPGALGFAIPVKGIHAGSDIDSYLWGDAGLFWLTNGVPFTVVDVSISYPPFFLESGGALYSGGGSIVRLKPDFSRDNNLNNKLEYKTPLSAASPVPARAISLDRMGSILIGGGFNLVNGTEAARIARLSNNGSLDPAFLPNVGTNSSNKLTPNYVSAIQPLPTGQILAGGNFLTVEGQSRPLIARLNQDGSLDRNFDLDVQGSSVDQIIPMPDGGFVVLGSVTNVNGMDVNGIFKLQPIPNEIPFTRFLWPTNGAEVVATGLVTTNLLQLQAWDPDGFLKQVVITLDGEPISTNSGGVINLALSLTNGTHMLTAMAEDEVGNRNSTAVTFQVVEPPTDVSLSAELSEGVLHINLTAPMILESSDDLINWAPVAEGAVQSTFTIDNTETNQHRFYRAVR
jgi:uncharacterized delta-60 repeat protein